MKTGWKTTEAWVTGLTAYLSTDVAMQDAVPPMVRASALGAMAIVAAAFIWSRTKVKSDGSAR